MVAAADDNNNDQGHISYKCSNPNCRRDLPAGEQPCPFCGNVGRDIIAVAPTDRISIRDTNTAVLSRLETDLGWLLATLAVTILVPVITYFVDLDRLTSMFVSIGSGLVAFGFGIKALMRVKRIYESR